MESRQDVQEDAEDPRARWQSSACLWLRASTADLTRCFADGRSRANSRTDLNLYRFEITKFTVAA